MSREGENLDTARETPDRGGAVCTAVTTGGLWGQEGQCGQAWGGASVAGLAGNCTTLRMADADEGDTTHEDPDIRPGRNQKMGFLKEKNLLGYNQGKRALGSVLEHGIQWPAGDSVLSSATRLQV